jgi:hypothetical protein
LRVFAGQAFAGLAFSPTVGVVMVRAKGGVVELGINGALGDSNDIIAVDTQKRWKITVESLRLSTASLCIDLLPSNVRWRTYIAYRNR